jgi:tRNA(fMet)-specific endonuclease VapC
VGILIDGSWLIALERGDGDLAGLRDEARAISVSTMSELLHGVHRAEGARRATRAASVERVPASMLALPITPHVARVRTRIWSILGRGGELLGRHDLWIGATALGYGLRLATPNPSEFRRIPGLRVLAA